MPEHGTDDTALEHAEVTAVEYEDDDGTRWRRYWDGDEIVEVPAR